ncbi:lysostaphin resistance A-like protein [Chloroflexota bacterium]
MKEALVYVQAITIAELIVVAIDPVWGIVCHILVLATLIARSALISEHTNQQLLLSVALVPLVRIISLSMPLADIPQIWWYPIIYAPLVVTAFIVMRLLNYKMEDVGLNFRLFPVQLAVALTGFLFGVAEYYILRPQPLIAELTWQEVWLPALILIVSTGFVEEFIFRGVLQRTASRLFGWWGIVYVSLLFAVLHVGFLSWIDVIFVFVVALFFGWVVKKTGSLLGVFLSHGITNSVLFLIAPFFF